MPACAVRKALLCLGHGQMTEHCPHCHKELNPQLHFVRASLLDLPNSLLAWDWPSAKWSSQVHCPCRHCSSTRGQSHIAQVWLR